MKKTSNLGLSLYESSDKFSITANADSLNANMELIDKAIAKKASISDIDIIPNYVKTEAENVINRVISAQTGKTFTFAALSDMHYGNGEYSDGIKRACQALKYIDERIKLDAVAILGDYTDSYITTDYNNAIEDFKGINSLLSDLRFAPNLRQQGNHDFYEVHSPLINRFIQAQSDDVEWGDKLGGYYYKDFDDYKLRIICVNANEKNGIDSNNQPTGNISCSKEQYEWFINSLDLSSKEDSTEWQILILSHQPLDWYDSDGVYSFAYILNAYKNGTNWSSDTLGISCDFSGKNSAVLIGNIHGHIHNLLTDNIHFKNIANGEKTDIWRMATPEGCIGRANQYDGAWKEDNAYPKTKNSAKDTSFCIYCIDLDTYTINAICYGAGYDRNLNYFDGTQQEPEVSGYTNQIPISIDTDGSVYNGGLGYKTGYRLGSAGNETTENAANIGVTGFVEVCGGDVIRFKNIPMDSGNATGHYIILYDESFNRVEEGCYRPSDTYDFVLSNRSYDENGYVTQFTLASSSLGYKYMRVSCTGLDADSIITINQEIK